MLRGFCLLLALLLWGTPPAAADTRFIRFRSDAHQYTLWYPSTVHLLQTSALPDQLSAVYKKTLHARTIAPLEHMDLALFLRLPQGHEIVPYMTLQVYPIPAGIGSNGKKFARSLLRQADDTYPGWVVRHFPVRYVFGGEDCWYTGYDANSPTTRIRVRTYSFLQTGSGLAYVFCYTDTQSQVRLHARLFDSIVRGIRFDQ